jgi:hypothetical protein
MLHLREEGVVGVGVARIEQVVDPREEGREVETHRLA